MLIRTPIIALFLAMLIAYAIVYFVELPSRPFSAGQLTALFCISYCVALGIALFFDPKAIERTKELSKINFYEEK